MPPMKLTCAVEVERVHYLSTNPALKGLMYPGCWEKNPLLTSEITFLTQYCSCSPDKFPSGCV